MSVEQPAIPSALSPEQVTLRQASADLRAEAQTLGDVTPLMDEATELVKRAIRQTLGFKLFPVQQIGAGVMAGGGIAEMFTGEGKTLTATVPLYLHALTGKGAHLATA
ncbi:MAG: preprotein translocase subunit SecA, partial [Pirellulaceae bacterium]